MKNLILIVLLLFSTQIFAMNYAKKYEGTVTKITGETIECTIVMSGAHRWRDEIYSKKALKIEVNNKKISLAPSDIISYSINLEDKWHTYWSVQIYNEYYLFMKKVVSGKLTLYTCKTYDLANSIHISHFVYAKQDQSEPLHLTWEEEGNQKKIIDYLKECEQVRSEIRRNDILLDRIYHWTMIANTYNENCHPAKQNVGVD